MKKIHIILFFTLWVIASSCSTYYVSNKQVMEVQQGMSRQNVERILGKPDYRRFDGNTEEWEFHRVSSVLYGNSIKIIVYFADGRVTSMDTFNGDEILLPPPVMMPPSVVVTNTPPVCPPQYEETSRRRTLMMHDEFDRFLRDFRMVIMPTEQIKYIDDVLLECNFTSAQCGKIIDQINSSDTQMTVMKRMYPQIVDKENFSPVVNKLFSSFDRDSMKKYIQAYHGEQRPGDAGYVRPRAMSAAEFDRFFNEYRGKSFESDRTRMLDEVVPPSGFTCSQCRKLVDMCTFQTDKNNMIKKLYPKIADKKNFSILTDVFTFEMDKREMREFADSYDSRRN